MMHRKCSDRGKGIPCFTRSPPRRSSKFRVIGATIENRLIRFRCDEKVWLYRIGNICRLTDAAFNL